ncbi:flagellar hook-length control protein FliK [Methylobacterium segetis]|uniref:flagellar hook-length control protein FliK n=1 Tax=Methylobacterium segetis TaxID=2488750 RepID=UPI0010459A8C|nr:flagellar hook-length control protein FliK [Methylobacterium segetis]
MTPLDTMLPGIRQRPDSASGRPSPEAGQGDVAAFEAMLGDLAEGRGMADVLGQTGPDRPEEPAAGAIPPDAPLPDATAALLALLPMPQAGRAGEDAEPRTPAARAVLRALLVRAAPGASPEEAAPTVPALAPAAGDFTRLMERAAGPTIVGLPLLGDRVPVSVVARETHFAPVRVVGPMEQAAPATPPVAGPLPSEAAIGEPVLAAEVARTDPQVPGAVARAGTATPSQGAGGAPSAQPAAGSNAEREDGADPVEGIGEPPLRTVRARLAENPRAASPVRSPATGLETAGERRRTALPETGTAGAGLRGEGREVEPATAAAPGSMGAVPSALPADTLRQIVDAIAPPERAGEPAAMPGTGRTEGPTRLLTLQLKPDDLGSVLIRMRLQDGRLALELQASREETAVLLRKDEHRLAELLRGAGYQTDLLTIQAGGAEMSQPGRGQSQLPSQPQGQGSTFPAMADGQNAGGSTPDQPAGRRPSARDEGPAGRRDEGHENHPGERDRGGLYL